MGSQLSLSKVQDIKTSLKSETIYILRLKYITFFTEMGQKAAEYLLLFYRLAFVIDKVYRTKACTKGCLGRIS